MGIFSEVYNKGKTLAAYRSTTFDLVSYQVFGTIMDAIKSSRKDIKLIGLTSTHRGEGVSTVARILGHALSNSSYISSLIVDAAIHNPSLHKTERISISPGLADVFLGRINNWKDVIKAKKKNICYLLPFGVVEKKDIPDFFVNPNVLDFLQGLKRSFDIVVFDLPPIGHYPEIMPFFTQLDSVIFVIKAHKTRFPAVKVALSRLKTSGVDVLGGILNGKRYFVPKYLYETL